MVRAIGQRASCHRWSASACSSIERWWGAVARSRSAAVARARQLEGAAGARRSRCCSGVSARLADAIARGFVLLRFDRFRFPASGHWRIRVPLDRLRRASRRPATQPPARAAKTHREPAAAAGAVYIIRFKLMFWRDPLHLPSLPLMPADVGVRRRLRPGRLRRRSRRVRRRRRVRPRCVRGSCGTAGAAEDRGARRQPHRGLGLLETAGVSGRCCRHARRGRLQLRGRERRRVRRHVGRRPAPRSTGRSRATCGC